MKWKWSEGMKNEPTVFYKTFFISKHLNHWEYKSLDNWRLNNYRENFVLKKKASSLMIAVIFQYLSEILISKVEEVWIFHERMKGHSNLTLIASLQWNSLLISFSTIDSLLNPFFYEICNSGFASTLSTASVILDCSMIRFKSEVEERTVHIKSAMRGKHF